MSPPPAPRSPGSGAAFPCLNPPGLTQGYPDAWYSLLLTSSPGIWTLFSLLGTEFAAHLRSSGNRSPAPSLGGEHGLDRLSHYPLGLSNWVNVSPSQGLSALFLGEGTGSRKLDSLGTG